MQQLKKQPLWQKTITLDLNTIIVLPIWNSGYATATADVHVGEGDQKCMGATGGV